MKTLLRGGSVVSAGGMKRADVLVDGEKIAQVGRNLSVQADKIVDVTGCILFPGFIDTNTHFDAVENGVTSADDFYSGSRAALRGGTTTVIDFAQSAKGESLHHALELQHQKANGRAFCDYGFHMTITDWNESIRGELPELFAKGVSSFRMYMAGTSLMLNDRDLCWALKELRRLGGICSVHCENESLIEGRTAERKNNGKLGVSSHPISRPYYLEAEAVSRLLRIAQAANAPVVISPVTNLDSLKEVEHARKRGQIVYTETCPHYLMLDESVYYSDEASAAQYVCTPPLREKAYQDALWKALRHDDIQVVSSDHRAFTPEQKVLGQEDFTKIPSGLPGVEHRGELLYSSGVGKRKLHIAQLCAALCENPARLYGLFPRKGIIHRGSDADIVVYDPRANHMIRADDCLSNAGYTPYEGFVTTGGIRQVWLRGNLAVENGKVLDQEPQGKFMVRGKNSL